jgi:pilus assembly protein CpaC
MSQQTYATKRKSIARALLGAVWLAAAATGGASAQQSIPLTEIRPDGDAAAAAAGTADAATTRSSATTTTTTTTTTSDVVADGLGEDGKVVLMVNKSQQITTKLPYKTVNVANPEIADVNQVNNDELLLTAKKPGNTQLIVWDVAGLSQTIDVTVMTDLQALQAQLDRIFPGAGIQATNVNGSVALRGRVKNLEMAKQAEAVAAPYSEKVLNFLEISGGQQVMLKVRFAEVSRSASSQLGFNGFATNGGSAAFGTNQGAGGSPIGAFANGASDVTINPAVTLFGAGHAGGWAFESFVQALRQNNLLRVLAEPNVIAISGEQASFLAGGEFPVPVPQTSGTGNTITIEYKKFGVKLNFMPTVLGDGRIRLKVEPEVSDLDYSKSVSFQGFTIPGIATRTLSTTIELNEGQSFAVAGLLNNRIVANKNVTPLLGDLPIVGALFRSVRYERSETELVVIVTPEIVAPLNPGQIGELPGEKWKDPTELQLFLDKNVGMIDGRSERRGGTKHVGAASSHGSSSSSSSGGGERAATTNAAAATADEDDQRSTPAEAARFRGQYGFVPATN